MAAFDSPSTSAPTVGSTARMNGWRSRTVRAALRDCAQVHGPDHELFRFGVDDSVWTVARLSAAADQFGRALLAAGARAGDALAVWSPGRPLWPVALLGAAGVGVKVCGLNTRYNVEELTHVLGELRPRWVLVATGFHTIDSLALVDRAVQRATVPHCDAPVVVECPPGDAVPHLPAPAADTDADRFEERAAGVRPIDPLLVQFTSGSTGHPKGVLVSQDAALRSAHHTWQGMGSSLGTASTAPCPTTTSEGRSVRACSPSPGASPS